MEVITWEHWLLTLKKKRYFNSQLLVVLLYSHFKYRAVIIDIFKQKVVVVKKEINAAVKKVTGKNIPEATYNKILREFGILLLNIYFFFKIAHSVAYFKQGKWIFKSGNLSEESEQALNKPEDTTMDDATGGD